MDIREEFETWIDDYGWSIQPDSTGIAGRYEDDRTQLAWEAWQASRESVPIDLPEITQKNIDFALNCHMEDPTDDEESGFYSGVSWCLAFLKQEIAKRNRK